MEETVYVMKEEWERVLLYKRLISSRWELGHAVSDAMHLKYSQSHALENVHTHKQILKAKNTITINSICLLFRISLEKNIKENVSSDFYWLLKVFFV